MSISFISLEELITAARASNKSTEASFMSSSGSDPPAAIIATGSSGSDDDMKQSSVDLLEALAAVINSSRLIKEIDIQNQINDLLD